MKWLIVALVLAAGSARADMEMPRPAPVRTCRTAASLDKVEACLRKLGKVVLVQKFDKARLYRVTSANADEGGDLGLSLYVERAGRWQLGGVFESPGSIYEMLAAAPLVVGTHAGFRLDIGQLVRTYVAIDGGQTLLPAVVTSHHVLLCSGDSWVCNQAVIACDVLVRGAAMWSFHGTLTIADNQAHVAGDRRNAGTLCQVPETQFLGWTQTQ